MTPCLSHKFPHVQSNQRTTSRLFNLLCNFFDSQGRRRVQIVT